MVRKFVFDNQFRISADIRPDIHLLLAKMVVAWSDWAFRGRSRSKISLTSSSKTNTAQSIICGTAPNSIAFIIGRAVAGLGSAGIFSGVINIMVITIPLHKRPMFQGIFGAVFGIASVAGPLIG